MADETYFSGLSPLRRPVYRRSLHSTGTGSVLGSGMEITHRDHSRRKPNELVGVAGFEPTTFRSQSGRATKLRYTP